MSLLDTRIPAGLDENGMDPDERRQFNTLQAHRALGLIMQRVPIGFRVFDWLIRDGGIEIMLSADSDHAKRAMVMALGEQFGFEYVENRHGSSQNMVSASGFYSGVSVKFWQLVSPCSCGCGVASC